MPGRVHRRPRLARPLVALALGMLLATRSAAAAESEPVVPADYASILLLRVLAYDRMLPARCEGKLVIGIVYDPAASASVQWKDQLLHALSQVGPRLPVRQMTAAVTTLAFSGPASFGESLRREAVSVMVLAPDLEAHVSEITHATRRSHVLSVGVMRSYLLKGVSLGLLVGPGRKAKVLVNVEASKAEGVEFEAGLLRLAELL